MIQGAIIIDIERCKGCALCVEACPFHLIELSQRNVNAKGYRYAQQHDEQHCTGCTACGIVCPDSCISVYRKKLP